MATVSVGKAILRQGKRLIEANRDDKHQCAAFAGVNIKEGLKNKFGQLYTSKPCHWDVRYIKDEERDYLLSTFQFDYHSWGECGLTEEVVTKFTHWLLNDSAWSSVFISKNAKKALKRGYVVGDGKAPSNLLVSGMVAKRHLWEYPTVVRVAHDLREQGVNGDLAYLMGLLCFVSVSARDLPMELNIAGYKTGHCPLDVHQYGLKCMKNFINHAPTYVKESFKEEANYTGYGTMFSGGGNNFRNTVMELFLKAGVKVAESNHSSPFAKVAQPQARKGYTTDYQEGIRRLVVVAKELYEQVKK